MLQQSRNIGLERLGRLREKSEADMVDAGERFTRLARPDAAPKVFTSFNLFPTPAKLAARVIEIADIRLGHKVLEPSAGMGNLLQPIADNLRPYERHISVEAVEINPDMCHHLSKTDFYMWVAARCADFLTWKAPHLFDRIVMNPPFKMGTDIKHIRHALAMLRSGGRLVSLCAAGPKQRAALQPIASQWIDLEPRAFAESGTNVQAAIVVIDL